MKAVYVDSSIIVAILLNEPIGKKMRKRLAIQDEVLSSSLIEAEVLSVSSREKVDLSLTYKILDYVSLVSPERTLREEYQSILVHGYCRGADLFHLACALYLDPEKELPFLTLDLKQKDLARKVGLRVIE